MKSLDAKLAEIKADPSSRAFILADAKDADMAFGVRATGPRSYLSAQGDRPARFSPEVWTREEFGHRNLPEFLDIIREVVHQGMVDIMLMSAYVNEQLSIKENLFDNSHVTPAARANDTTPMAIYGLIRVAEKPAEPLGSNLTAEEVEARFSGTGLGRKTLGELCAELKLDPAQAAASLQRAGIEAMPGDNLRDLADANDMSPIDLLKIILVPAAADTR